MVMALLTWTTPGRSVSRQTYSLFFELASELLEFNLDSLELGQFALDEPGCKLGAMSDTFRSQNVNVAELVLRSLEVGKLEVPFVDQRLDAEIDRPEAHAKFLGDFPLRGVGSAFQKAQDPEMHVFALLSYFVTDHGIDRYSPDQSYRTAGDSGPSVTAVFYEQAEASRSFLNA